jgi:hypothetical protein
MNHDDLWIWEEPYEESDIFLKSNVINANEEYDFPTVKFSESLSHESSLIITDIPSPGVAFNNLLNTVLHLFEKISSITSFISNPNGERERYEYCIDRFDFGDDSFSVTSCYKSYFKPPYPEPFYCSVNEISDNNIDFSKSDYSIFMIDINRVFPPIGPPFV